MFLPYPEPSREGKVLLRAVQRRFGRVPPHFELFAALNPARFKMFLDEIAYLGAHPRIAPDFFVFLRRAVAEREGYGYCRRFNEAMLRERGYDEDTIAAVLADPAALPMDGAHRGLFVVALGAMEDPAGFDAGSLERLRTEGWSDGDIFDALDHAAFLYKYFRLISAYLEFADAS
jgi:hypothetical protein